MLFSLEAQHNPDSRGSRRKNASPKLVTRTPEPKGAAQGAVVLQAVLKIPDAVAEFRAALCSCCAREHLRVEELEEDARQHDAGLQRQQPHAPCNEGGRGAVGEQEVASRREMISAAWSHELRASCILLASISRFTDISRKVLALVLV